ncbi:MAG: CHAT domain-containing protein [Nitrospira sp.]|nr:MAG: CHAT domain-containing protein [Nitrospira sp.]
MLRTLVLKFRPLAFSLQPEPLQPIHLACLLLCAAVLIPSMATSASAPPSVADETMAQGTQAFQRGSYEDALGKWKEAARQYDAQGQVHQQSQALVAAARAAESLGQTRQALQLLELASTLAQKEPDALWRATVLAQLGHTYLTARQLDAASTHLTQARELANRSVSPALTATLLNDLGILHALQNHHDEALAAFTDTIQLAQQAGLPLVALHARLNAARTNIQLNRPMASRMWIDQALEQVDVLPPSREKAIGLMNIGLLYRRLLSSLPDLHAPLVLRAAGAMQESASLAEQLGDTRTLSFALGHLGHLYESEQRLDEALSFTRRAIFSAQSVDAPESLYRWQWQLGRQLAATGKLDDAIASYRQASGTLQPIRPSIAMTAAHSSWLDEDPIRPLFFELADLLLQRASLTEEQPAATQYLLAARDAIEAYKAAELRDYFKDECVDALQARLIKFDSLVANTAVIYPILFPTRLELLVSLPSGMMRIAVPVGAEALTKEIRLFRRTVEKRTTREYLPHAQQLYDWLIRPLESEFAKQRIATLVFVPDSALRTIPMAALHDGSTFLINKYAVALTPGLTLTDPRPLNREKVRVLTTGLTKAVQGFPSLPYVADEVETIRSLYSSNQLMNQDFRAQRLEEELRDGRYGILHIATHGMFSTSANDSFLLTFDEKLTMSTLDRLIGLFRFREDPLELLTLSACQTGVGDDRAALGLAGVAIKSGARSALATLWFINDEASAALVSEFYRQLRNPKLSKAQALQSAQQKLLADRVYEHPAYWSAFLLLNNWL